MQLLCDLRKEDEELVSPQEPPDPTQHGLGRGEKGFGGSVSVSPYGSTLYAADPLFWARGTEHGTPLLLG